jgi:hypothetical protein
MRHTIDLLSNSDDAPRNTEDDDNDSRDPRCKIDAD